MTLQLHHTFLHNEEFMKNGLQYNYLVHGGHMKGSAMTKRLLFPLCAALLATTALTTPVSAGGYIEDVGNATLDVVPNAARRGAEVADAAAADLGPIGGLLGGVLGLVGGAVEGVLKTGAAVVNAD